MLLPVPTPDDVNPAKNAADISIVIVLFTVFFIVFLPPYLFFLPIRYTIENITNAGMKHTTIVNTKLLGCREIVVLYASGLCTGSSGIIFVRIRPNPQD
jgi:hypothetical protein